MTTDALPKAVQDCHKLMLLVIPLLDDFPRSRRFPFGIGLDVRLVGIPVITACSRTKYGRLRRAKLKSRSSELRSLRFSCVGSTRI
jgi:hypothetical protein